MLSQINPAFSSHGAEPRGKGIITSIHPRVKNTEYSGKGGIKNIFSLLIGGCFFVPWAAAAQDIGTIIGNVTDAARRVVTLLLVIATLVFLWGVVQFIAGSGDPAKRDKAKGIMMWGIIGLAVMAAAWGAAGILIAFFGATTPPTIPPGPVPLL